MHHKQVQVKGVARLTALSNAAARVQQLDAVRLKTEKNFVDDNSVRGGGFKHLLVKHFGVLLTKPKANH